MNLLVGGLNLPFESPPHELTQLSSALAAVDRGCAMVQFGLHAHSTGFILWKVTYCTQFCTPPAAPADTLGSIKRVSAYDTLEFTAAEAMMEATFPSQYYILRELLAEKYYFKTDYSGFVGNYFKTCIFCLK